MLRCHKSAEESPHLEQVRDRHNPSRDVTNQR
jgi:hypothetical protein